MKVVDLHSFSSCLTFSIPLSLTQNLFFRYGQIRVLFPFSITYSRWILSIDLRNTFATRTSLLFVIFNFIIFVKLYKSSKIPEMFVGNYLLKYIRTVAGKLILLGIFVNCSEYMAISSCHKICFSARFVQQFLLPHQIQNRHIFFKFLLLVSSQA